MCKCRSWRAVSLPTSSMKKRRMFPQSSITASLIKPCVSLTPPGRNNGCQTPLFSPALRLIAELAVLRWDSEGWHALQAGERELPPHRRGSCNSAHNMTCCYGRGGDRKHSSRLPKRISFVQPQVKDFGEELQPTCQSAGFCKTVDC